MEKDEIKKLKEINRALEKELEEKQESLRRKAVSW
jgi:hypothetical protein